MSVTEYISMYAINMTFSILLTILAFREMSCGSDFQCKYVSPCQRKDRNATLVTALYDIHRNEWDKWKRSMNEYLLYFEQVLSLDVPMVIFVAETLAEFVHEKRKEKSCYTQIQIQSFDEIRLYAYHNDIANVLDSIAFREDNNMLEHPEGYSADYIVITNNKAEFVRKAATLNPFMTTHFYWMDAGYGHGNEIFPRRTKWAPCSLLDHSGAITYITFFDATYYKNVNKNNDKLHKLKIHPLINGGFFGGDQFTITEYADFYEDIFVRDLKRNIVDDDQGTALQVYIEIPELFNFVRGDWYDVFELFY